MTLMAAASDCVIHSGTRTNHLAPYGASDDERRAAMHSIGDDNGRPLE